MTTFATPTYDGIVAHPLDGHAPTDIVACGAIRTCVFTACVCARRLSRICRYAARNRRTSHCPNVRGVHNTIPHTVLQCVLIVYCKITKAVVHVLPLHAQLWQHRRRRAAHNAFVQCTMFIVPAPRHHQTYIIRRFCFPLSNV